MPDREKREFKIRFLEEPATQRRNRRRRVMPEGEETREKPQSGEDEEFYTVRLTINPKSVSGLPYTFWEVDQLQNRESELYDELQKQRHILSERFEQVAQKGDRTDPLDPAGRPLSVSFFLPTRRVSIQRGSVTLIAVLGAIYAGVKDYESIRRGLLLIAEDMRGIVASLFPSTFWALWTIDSEVMVGTPSPIPQPAGASSETPPPAPTPAGQGSSRSLTQSGIDWVAGAPQRGSNRVARHAFILYLAITNLVLIVFLGLLLVRASS